MIMSSSSTCSSTTSTSPGLSPSSESSSSESSPRPNLVTQSNAEPSTNARINSNLNSNSLNPTDFASQPRFPIPPRVPFNAPAGTRPHIFELSNVSRLVENVFRNSAPYVMNLLRPFTHNHPRQSSVREPPVRFPNQRAIAMSRHQSVSSIFPTTSASNRPQPIEQNSRSNSCVTAWTDLELLREARMTLKDLIAEISKTTTTSPQESDIDYGRTARHVPHDSATRKEPSLRIPRPNLVQSESHLQTSIYGSRSSSSAQNEAIIQTSQETAHPSEFDHKILNSRSTDHSSRTNPEADIRDIEKVVEMAMRARWDIQIFAKHMLNECNRHPHKDFERFLDFKFCYQVFELEEYKNVDAKCSAYKEKERERMLEPKIAHLVKLQDENNFFFARLQYAMFMIKLYMKFDKVKEITMDIRKVEEHINTLDEWATDSSDSEDNGD